MNFKWREITPSEGRGWIYIEEKLENLFSEGRIKISNERSPMLKEFMNEDNNFKSIETVWTDIKIGGF